MVAMDLTQEIGGTGEKVLECLLQYPLILALEREFALLSLTTTY